MSPEAEAAVLAALVEARSMIVLSVANAMLRDIRAGRYVAARHPVIREIDAALALAVAS